MVHEIQHHSESVPHTGERQLHSELLITGQLPPNGVAATPRRGEEGLPCTKKASKQLFEPQQGVQDSSLGVRHTKIIKITFVTGPQLVVKHWSGVRRNKII